MDKDLPERDFCPLHLAPMAQAGTLNEDKTPGQGAGKLFWFALLASLLVHAILLAVWTIRPADVKERALEQSLSITLNAAVTDTAEAETVPEQEPSAVDESITPELPPPPENTVMADNVPEQEPPAVEESTKPEPPPSPENPAASQEITSDKRRIDIHALDIAPHPLPATGEAERGNVFHPALRDQISEARTRRERLHNTQKPDLPSWQDASGQTWLDLGNGTCMRSAAGDSWGTTSWELPTRCKGRLTEGESMLRSLQRTLDNQ